MAETHKPFSGRIEDRGLSISTCPNGGFIVWRLGGGNGFMDIPIAAFSSAIDISNWLANALDMHESLSARAPTTTQGEAP